MSVLEPLSAVPVFDAIATGPPAPEVERSDSIIIDVSSAACSGGVIGLLAVVGGVVCNVRRSAD